MPYVGQLIVCGLVGFGVSFCVILLTLRAVLRLKIGHRTTDFHHGHRVAISRLGGISLAAAFVSLIFLALALFNLKFSSDYMSIAIISLAMFGLGLWDDLRGLGAKNKLYGQLLIATAAYFMGIGIFHFKIPFTDNIIDLGFWSWPATIFWIVSMTNLINLIDGVDGLAGGISLMLMLLLAVEGGTASTVSFIASGMVGALLAFLRFNFPPARIYMGDSGAYFLGCLMGILTITSAHKGTVVAALIAPLFVLALPILDTSLAIIRRGFQGLPLFRADRKHIHHRLLETGLSRRGVVLGIYAFTSFFLGLGFIAFWWRGQFLPLVLGISVLALLLAAGRLNFSREWFAVGRVLGNSLNRRAEIQYTLAQTRWLMMEGNRTERVVDICEDTVFIARKLGFTSMRVRLEDGERTWQIQPVNGDNEYCFQHKFPGNRYCFIELSVASVQAGDTRFLRRKTHIKPGAPNGNGYKANVTQEAVLPSHEDFKLISELLAEGWAKAITVWKVQNQAHLRFDIQEILPGESPPAIIPAIQISTAD